MHAQLKLALLVLVGLCLALCTSAWVYWTGLSGSFLLDDGANIVVPFIRNPDWYGIVYTVTHNGSGILGRSVSMLSFVLTGMQYDLDPWGYKFHNLMLHLLNGVLLFQLLLMLLPLLDRQLSERRGLLVAGCASTLWLLHPLFVSTVLYAVQRMTEMSALFTLLSLIAYLKARLSLNSSWRYLIYAYVLFPLLGVLAVLSKENGALIPFYLLIIELLAFRTRLATLRDNWRIAVPVVCYVLAPLLFGMVVLLLKFESIADYSTRTFTLEERLLTQIHVVFFYIRLIVLPRIGAMSLFQDDFPVQSDWDVTTVLLLGVLLALPYIVFRLRAVMPVISFGLAWFLVSHLMESTVIPLEMVFEHRNYLAAIGLLMAMVHAILQQQFLPRLYWLIPVMIFGMAFMTAARSKEWGNYELFTEMAIRDHPDSGRAQNSYVNLLTARREYEKATAQLDVMSGQYNEPGIYLHALVLKCGIEIKDDAALTEVTRLLAVVPVSVYALNSLQSLINNVVAGRCKQLSLDEVESLVVKALSYPMNQHNVSTHAYLLRLQGIIAFGKGYYAAGYSYFMTAHEMTNDSSLLHDLLGYQLSLAKLDDAAETLELVENRNKARFGIDTWKVRQLRERFEAAKEKKGP